MKTCTACKKKKKISEFREDCGEFGIIENNMCRTCMKKGSDFERVLMNIAVDTAGGCFDKMVRLNGGWHLRFRFDHPVAQFVPLEMAQSIDMPLKKGDVVRCKTNPNHHWGISIFVKQLAYSDWLLQEIGGNATLKMLNEDLDVLRFMSPSRLYTGHKAKVYQWASSKAFSERYNGEAGQFKRCGGVEFDGDTLIIWCRAHIFAMERLGDDEKTFYAQPKRFTMPWGKTTRLKDIIASMSEQGFGSDFEYAPEKPIEGQAGYASFTRKDIEKVLNR